MLCFYGRKPFISKNYLLLFFLSAVNFGTRIIGDSIMKIKFWGLFLYFYLIVVLPFAFAMELKEDLDPSSNKGFSHQKPTIDNSTFERCSLKLIKNKEGIDLLIKLCNAHKNYHQKFKERSYSDLNFDDLFEKIYLIEAAKGEGLIGNVFGVYGFYFKENEQPEQLVGIVKMLGGYIQEHSLEGYSECEMAMHPNFRRKGLGYIFCKLFHKEIIEPILEKEIKFQNNQITTFHGTIGYVHAKNLASRHLATKLGLIPVRLNCKPYLKGGEALQIIYVYPPSTAANGIIAQLSEDNKNTLLSNKLENNIDVLVSYLESNVEQFVKDQFESLSNEVKKVGTIINGEDWENKEFIEPIKLAFADFLKQAFPEQELLNLAINVALFQTGLNLLNTTDILTTIKNGPLEQFLKSQHKDLHDKLNKALSLS